MTREKVAVALVKFDEGKTDFQIAQVVGARAIDQFKVFELRYIRGNNDTESYLAKQSQLDRVKADTYASWGKMRRFLRSASLSLFEIKLLMLCDSCGALRYRYSRRRHHQRIVKTLMYISF